MARAGYGDLEVGAETSSVQAVHPVGSASAPGIAFSTDTDVGLYRVDANELGISVGGTGQLAIIDGVLQPITTNDIDLGTASLQFKNAYFDGTLEADAITIGGTNVVTGSVVTTLGTVTSGTWQGTAIGATYIAADAVTGAKIADDAIDSEHYTDGSIDTAHLASDVVTGAKVADDAIDSEHYTDGSIDTAHLAADVITGAKLADNAVDSEHYTDGSIDTAHIANLQITTALIANDAVTAAKIPDDAIDSEHYTDGSIDTAHLAADAVTGAKIADDAINSEHYTDASIDTAHIANLQITTALIAADAVTAAKIGDDVIDSEHYADGSIDTAHIADNQVTVAKLADIARGSIIYGNASAASAELTKGGANTVLTSDGTDLSWVALSGSTIGTATNINVTAVSDDDTVYPVFVTGTSGSNAAEVASGFTFNPSTSVLTAPGEIDAASLDISGSADIDGTMEADAITVDGVTLAEYIADTVGAMVSSNTETNIAVTYEDGDNTLDFVVASDLNTTGNAATVTTNANLTGNVTSSGNATTLVLNDLSAATVSVANDSIAIIDADGSNASKKESIADFVSAIAGDNLTASNGQLAASGGGVPNAFFFA